MFIGELGTNRQLPTNTDPVGLDNPQPPSRRLGLKHKQSSPKQSECVVDALCVRAQHPDARVTCRRVGTDVGEIQIESNEDPILCLRGIKDSRIGVASQLLVEHRVHIVTSLAKQGFSITRQILVKFEPDRHPTRSGWDGNDAFSR